MNLPPSRYDYQKLPFSAYDKIVLFDKINNLMDFNLSTFDTTEFQLNTARVAYLHQHLIVL